MPVAVVLLLLIFSNLGVDSCFAAMQPPQSPTIPDPKIVFEEVDKDIARQLRGDIREGMQRVERFFGKPFSKAFAVNICPDRAAFDAYFKKRWNLPKTEKWMVAMGVADTLLLLSPRVWATEAVEHDAKDAKHIKMLLAHELVHVYHGQWCPKPDFDGMDDLGWFVEGLATYVSGQLAGDHRNAAKEAIKAGKAPVKLAEAWSGRYRYGVCGSLCQFVDRRWGRETLRKLMRVSKPVEALAVLGIGEQEFLTAWREAVTGTTGGPCDIKYRAGF